MKKETIEKLFRRYIGIYDDVVFRTTGEYLDETIKNEINSEVDLIFKEYEQMTNLDEFNSFSAKIQDIINKVLTRSKHLNKVLIEKEIKKQFNLFENNPFVYIQKEVDETISKIIPDSNNNYYIPYNPQLNSIANKGYYINFDSAKIAEHIEKNASKFKDERNKIIAQGDEEHEKILKIALQKLNDYPIQYCKETFDKYFYDNWIDKLLIYPNSIKNQITNDIISSGLNPHTKEYEQLLDSLFASKNNKSIDLCKNLITPSSCPDNYLKDFMCNFTDTIISRYDIINNFTDIWITLLYKNISKSYKNNLLKKYNIVSNNINKITDVSIIRFNNFMNNFNGGGSSQLTKDFVISLEDKGFLLMIINMVDAELTLLINELETVKFDKIKKSFILNDKYSNIINDYYKYLGDTSTVENKTNDSYAEKILTGKESIQADENFNKQLHKIDILYSLIENFNKQYKYKYILENIKSKFKNIIKIKKD